jgi:hypothetical protein
LRSSILSPGKKKASKKVTRPAIEAIVRQS